MKKLLFLIPIGGWIATYFVWKYASVILSSPHSFGVGLWWLVTSVAVPTFLVVVSTVFALIANE